MSEICFSPVEMNHKVGKVRHVFGQSWCYVQTGQYKVFHLVCQLLFQSHKSRSLAVTVFCSESAVVIFCHIWMSISQVTLAAAYQSVLYETAL